MKRLLSIFTFSFLFLTQSVYGQLNTLEPQYRAQLDALFDSYYNPENTGAVMAIVKDGEAVYKNSQGLANIEISYTYN